MFVTDTFPVPMILAGVAACATRAGRCVARWLRGAARAATRCPSVSILATAIFAFAVSAGFSTFIRRPLPAVHDEFSYLLAADTFAHGRLTNPTPAMWRHLETIHEIMQPTYASKYPPGTGLVMAAAQVLTGRPIVGVWFAAAIGAAAVYWMMLGRLPRRWALLGALLVVMDGAVFQWSQEFWGGSLTMTGGALVAGAWLRLMDRPRMGPATWLAIGAVILANTRPFEGMLIVLPALAILGWRWFFAGNRRASAATATQDANNATGRDVLRQLVIPISGVAIVGLAFMLIYNHRVTGHWLELPYMLHEEQVSPVPAFLFQHVRPTPDATAYAFPEIKDQHLVWERKFYDNGRAHPRAYLLEKIANLSTAYFGGMGLLFALVALPWVIRRDRRMALAALLLAPLALGVCLETFMYPHYVAAGVGLLFLLLMQCLRFLCTWQRGRRIGQILAWSIVLISAHGEFTAIHQMAYGIWGDKEIAKPRQEIIDQLTRQGGKHLVLVRYLPGHEPETEWVYNAADVDGSAIVWAHDMPGNNRGIRDYYNDRQAWLLEVGMTAASIHLLPYPTDRP